MYCVSDGKKYSLPSAVPDGGAGGPGGRAAAAGLRGAGGLGGAGPGALRALQGLHVPQHEVRGRRPALQVRLLQGHH